MTRRPWRLYAARATSPFPHLFVLPSLKNPIPTLPENPALLAAFLPTNSAEDPEKGHGREATRCYYICPVPDDLPDASRWPKLKAIGIAISNTQRDGKDCNEVRYYILSKYLSGRRFAEAVRDHWGIENRLHWQLDVTFQEDQCRIRKGHADANFSILRRTALSLLKNESTRKVGIKNKRLAAALDEAYLEKVLVGT